MIYLEAGQQAPQKQNKQQYFGIPMWGQDNKTTNNKIQPAQYL